MKDRQFAGWSTREREVLVAAQKAIRENDQKALEALLRAALEHHGQYLAEEIRKLQ